MKAFTDADVQNDGINASRDELIHDAPEWMQRGLQQTRSGYGKKLNSGLKVRFNGRDYRVYATCFSNVATLWFTVRGRKLYIR